MRAKAFAALQAGVRSPVLPAYLIGENDAGERKTLS